MELNHILSIETLNTQFIQGLEAIVQDLIDIGYDAERVSKIAEKIEYFDTFTPPHLFGIMFNTIEREIIKGIEEIEDWVNPFSAEPYIFKKRNGMLYPYVKRWFDWLEYEGKIHTNQEQKRQYLYTKENGAYEQLFDMNEEAILTLEGYFWQNDNIVSNFSIKGE